MRYVSTAIINNSEAVAVVLPLGRLPSFVPDKLPPLTYHVSDEVEVGWVKNYTVEPQYDVETGEMADPGEFEFVPPPESGLEARVAAYTTAVQDRLDRFAQTRGYDGIMSACTYVTSDVPSFRAEAVYCVTARDNTWATCYQIMNEALAGQRPIPALDALFELLPALMWPEGEV